MTHRQLVKLAPKLYLSDLTRLSYQQLLNDYAVDHERQTVMDFHRHIKSALIDALEEDLLDRDPTRKAIIKGVQRRKHKSKFLNQHEMQSLLDVLVLDEDVNWDYFLLLIAKTGLRFAGALALTPKDFDFAHQYLNVSKNWDYKAARSGFAPTKNKSSMRKVQVDWQTVIQFSQLTKDLPDDKPIFVESKVYNDTVNHHLARLCQKAEIPVISVHGLRHTRTVCWCEYRFGSKKTGAR